MFKPISTQIYVDLHLMHVNFGDIPPSSPSFLAGSPPSAVKKDQPT